ncbi:nucleotidyltransferase substrate binding protein [Cecembia lonarensis]|uniref:Nucleotidyltransferase substrate binding protein, family n=1 Tax=Cecembia lonarensis (strain CCUG 58316 / KCTC 22772 / LW9) TaxID=1225176 RepID=K1LAN1_CECL9|nr:nucleotidyltransferase substrate binding protein [Cecembia lonarensis]EKB49262.1 nucleotidyltransferase substrate binding protein, family [Cecembia lonarensis LW9]
MKNIPITCEKCFLDFQEALEELHEMVISVKGTEIDERNQKRIIRSFEITHELALKTMGEYFRKMGRKLPDGPRDTTVEAFNEDLIDDGKTWLDMIIERIKYGPLYPENPQKNLAQNVTQKYIRLFLNFERKMKGLME